MDSMAGWGHEAVVVFERLADAYDQEDELGVAQFFAAGGSLDLAAWGRGMLLTPTEVLTGARRLWFMEEPRAAGTTVEIHHLFLSTQGAAAWWSAHDDVGSEQWIELYDVGPRGEISSRIYADGGMTAAGTRVQMGELYSRYVDAWRDRDRAGLAAVYADGIVVRDGLTGDERFGLWELLEEIDLGPPVDRGPPPTVFFYAVLGRQIEIMAVMQSADPCPALELRRLIIDAGSIVDETRYAHVPSTRRCGMTETGGWWEEFRPPEPPEGIVAGALDTGERTIDMVNASPAHFPFIEWLIQKFDDAGLEEPDVAAVWFPPSNDCVSRSGLALESDARYEGQHTVLICFDSDGLRAGESAEQDRQWSEAAANWSLHEFAHIWMLDHLDSQRQEAFMDRVAAPSWRSVKTPWAERGVELAATTISWGTAGDELARYMIDPSPSCVELRSRYQLLTGRLPVTSCP